MEAVMRNGKILLMSIILMALIFCTSNISNAGVWEATSPDGSITLQILDYYQYYDGTMWTIAWNNTRNSAIASQLNTYGQPIGYLYADFYSAYYDLYQVVGGNWAYLGSYYY
ncbi:secreted protein [Candidatus Magnetoovum chiemensis]|nr:secreted protein [Candidatus Magnetoovum chiemensis]